MDFRVILGSAGSPIRLCPTEGRALVRCGSVWFGGVRRPKKGKIKKLAVVFCGSVWFGGVRRPKKGKKLKNVRGG